MEQDLKAHIEYLLCVNIDTIKSVSGGDISRAYLLETATERFFCKLNHGNQAYTMFMAEKTGLEAIANTKTIAIPKILLCETLKKGALLIMEYIEPKKVSTTKDMELLGHHLAALHMASISQTYGFESDNFIGSLPQSNQKHQDWNTFYAQERILPQLKLALEKNRLSPTEVPSENRLLQSFENYFPKVRPSLLHGDLWGGNYLIAGNGTPYLIDPAVYYGHHEVDLAMTRLFGGFSNSFYSAYEEMVHKEHGWQSRVDVYQLYYLLVHLNLFGSSYYGQVSRMLGRYF